MRSRAEILASLPIGSNRHANAALLPLNPSTLPADYNTPQLSALASALVSRLRFAGLHGLSFDGRRDLYQSLGWPREVSYSDFRALYRRGGIAKRAIDLWPDETWSSGAQVIEDTDPNSLTAFERDVQELAQRLDLWGVMRRADVLRSFGTFAVVLVGAPGDVSQPLTQLNTPSNVAYLRPYGEIDVNIADNDLDGDTQSQRYGQPEFYTIKLQTTGRNSLSRKVHWTRVLHVVENPIDSDLYGAPTLEASYNDLLCLTLIVGGGSEAFWRNVFGGKTFLDLHPDVKFRNAAEETALADQIEELMHDARDYVKTRGITPRRIEHTVQHFGGDVETVLRLVAATMGVSYERFIGAELGLRSSETNERAFNNKVMLRRVRYAEPHVRQLVDRWIQYGAVAEPEEYAFLWPESDELDEQSKATMAGAIANANSSQVASGDTPVMTSAEIRQRVFDLGPIEDTDFDVDNTQDDNTNPTDDDTQRSQSSFRALFDTTDRDATEPEWRVIHRVADANRNSLATYLRDAFMATHDAIDLQQLQRDIESGNRFLVVATVTRAIDELDAALRDSLYPRLLSVAVDGGLAALRSARARGGLLRTNVAMRNNQFTMQFDAQSPRTIAWARTRAAQLVTEISTVTRDAIRALLSTAFVEGLAPRRLATFIRSAVGLRTDQIRTLQRYIETLPATLTEAQRLSRIGRRTSKLLRQRAVLIARTEVITAANTGQRELWLQARDGGLLPTEQKRVWITTPDSRNDNCPICPPMDGQIRGLEEQFVTGEGGLVDGPTAHPNCRCGVGLATRDDISRAGGTV